jgi:EAL domain-containing protein (putative c-di-GMP-specific phosphodiesterase class I)
MALLESWSRLAEDLVRAGPGGALEWEGVTLRTRFQPIYSASRATCVGYEALARAADPIGRGLATESVFGVVAGQRRIFLDRICRALHLRNFATVDPGQGTLFVNVRPEAAVSDARCTSEYASLIRYYGLVPKRICMEIVESDCEDEAMLSDAVHAYRSMGASIAIDDFGTGRSNFDRILAFRPDMVKLDRCMLQEAMGRSRAASALAPVIRLLHEAGAQVVMEGVESSAEALVAIDAGADLLQGNYFAAPAATLCDDRFNSGVLHRLWGMREASPVGDD